MNSFLAPARRTFHALLAGALLASLPAAIYAQDGEALSAASPSPGMRTDSVGLSPTPRDTIARAETSSFPDTVVRTGGAPPPDTARRAAAPMPDHSPDADSAVTEDHPRIQQWEYMDAGAPRYTMTGKLPYRQSYIQTGTLTAFGGALLGLATAITWYQQAWYPDSTKGPFHFQVDWTYAKEFDKIGHAFGGWMSSYCSYEAFIASGLSQEDAAIWGMAGGLFFQTFIEVQDGFHTNYGFDWTDELGNIMGAGYFYAQRKVPFLRNFDPKWSVGPTNRDAAREAAQIRSRLIVDDYDRQDMWLSVKMHNILPESLKPYWPKWLQLAVGAGARDVELIGYTPYRVLHLSLDYNLVEMLPDLGPFGNWLVQGINAFHLPAPALQLWPKVKFELIYPFHL